jgi:transposase
MDRLGYSNHDTRLRAVLAIQNGMSKTQVAQAFGTDRSTVHRWWQRFQNQGVHGLERRPVSGRPRALQSIKVSKLKSIVLAPARRYGFETDLWTVQRVHQVINRLGTERVSEDTIWRRLRDIGLTWQTPEREYHQMDPAVRQQWQAVTLPEIRKTLRETRGILYCEDEASISLTPVLSKTWAMRGHPRKVSVTGNRATVAAMSAISPKGRLVFRLHQKRITSVEVVEFLEQLLWMHQRRHVVVVMDQARPHTSQVTRSFIASQPRLHVFYLPPYSPDWNPDEKVWNHLKNHELKAHQAKTKEELFELTNAKLRGMKNEPALLRGLYFRCCVAELLR